MLFNIVTVFPGILIGTIAIAMGMINQLGL